MALNILCTDKGREALRNILEYGLYKSIIVGKFRASSDFIGAGATDQEKRDNFQASVLTPDKYISSQVADGNSLTYYCQLFPPTEVSNLMSAVGLYFKLLTPVEEEYYEMHPTENPFDSINTGDSNNLFGICWFDSLAEAIPAGILQQMIPKFEFSNGDIAGAVYNFQPDWEKNNNQDRAIIGLTAGAGTQFNKIILEIAKINVRLKNIENILKI